ncbi:hypothetical protein VTP01DRAFT_4120 [Rhizomucor pusillus]|uniref:uncharacterized protein n=1 Tax=Rhizomucor pusillus TaxID=4840 RepID=UPI0037437020
MNAPRPPPPPPSASSSSYFADAGHIYGVPAAGYPANTVPFPLAVAGDKPHVPSMKAPQPSQISMDTMSTHSNHAYRHFSLPPPPIPHTPVPTESARIRRVSTGANVRGEGWKLAGRPKTLSFHDQKTHRESVGATIVEPKTPGTYFHTSAPRESTSFVGGFVLPPQPLPHTAPNSAPAMYHHHHHHHHQQHQQPAYNEATHMAPPVRHYSAPEYNEYGIQNHQQQHYPYQPTQHQQAYQHPPPAHVLQNADHIQLPPAPSQPSQPVTEVVPTYPQSHQSARISLPPPARQQTSPNNHHPPLQHVRSQPYLSSSHSSVLPSATSHMSVPPSSLSNAVQTPPVIQQQEDPKEDHKKEPAKSKSKSKEKAPAIKRQITVQSINKEHRVWIDIAPKETGSTLADKIYVIATFKTRRVLSITTASGRKIPLNSKRVFSTMADVEGFQDGEQWQVEWAAPDRNAVDRFFSRIVR